MCPFYDLENCFFVIVGIMFHNDLSEKEEILTKDQEKQKEDKNLSAAKNKNAEYKRQIEQFKQQIGSSENMIKMQDNDIARLKYVISEAEAEKHLAMVVCPPGSGKKGCHRKGEQEPQKGQHAPD